MTKFEIGLQLGTEARDAGESDEPVVYIPFTEALAECGTPEEMEQLVEGWRAAWE